MPLQQHHRPPPRWPRETQEKIWVIVDRGRNAERGTKGNAECGTRNAESLALASDDAVCPSGSMVRIPHSAFRIPHFPPFRIPHSAFRISSKGILIRARAVDRRDRNIQLAQI